MKSSVFIMIMGLLMVAPFRAVADVNIFACEPEWQSLAKAIGKNNVDIMSATNAFMDPHHIRARPSLIAAIRRSDLLICSGSELEVGWLPILLEKAAATVQPGQIGHLMAADYVTRLDIPEHLDRAHGDIHPSGNPHVHLDPHNITIIAKEITRRLSVIDETNASYYQENLKTFLVKWEQALHQWEKKAASLRNMPIVVHHKNWSYLVKWLGLKEVATLEPKPGIPPSFSHLKTLLDLLAHQPAKIIIHAPFEDNDAAIWLSEKTSLPVLKLPFTIGGNEEVIDLFSLFDNTITLLLSANTHGKH